MQPLPRAPANGLRFLLAALVLVGGGRAATAQDSMRCDGGLVSVGDSKLDLLGKCGTPTLAEDRLEERGGTFPLGRLRVSVTIERWTYDSGPNQFVQHVTLDTGRIVAIERGGYGYASAAAPRPLRLPRARCEASVLRRGDGTYDVLARCGPPATQDLRLEQEEVLASDGVQAISVGRTVRIEVWAYDFGPRSFVRHLTFADGKLVKIETGSYGYAR